MPPLPEEENTELDAIALNGAVANDKLEEIKDVAEAALVQQDRTLEAVRDLEAPLEASVLLQAEIRDNIKNVPQATIEDGAAITIKGIKGDDGYTPVKGTDYYTPEEQEELIQTILPSATPIRGVDYYTEEELADFARETLEAATPIKGVHYFDGLDGKDGKDGEPGKDGRDGRDGARGPKGAKGDPGRDGSPDTGEQIVAKIDGLLPYSAIKDAPQWKNPASRDYDLVELKDVSISNPTNNQVLKYNASTGLWENGTGGGGSGTVETIVAGTGISVDATDPANPIVSATASAPAWGDITGTLSDQTDLQEALDAKYTLPSLTAGSVLFSNGSTIAQDNANLFYNDSDNRLGVGTASPTRRLSVFSSSDDYQLAIGAAGANYDVGRNNTTGFLNTYGNQSGYVGYSWGGVNGEYLKILNDGSVGIGVTNPTYKLDIQANSTTVNGFRVTNSTNGANAQIQNRLVNNLGAIAYYGITASSYAGFGPINDGAAFYGSNEVPTVILTQSAHPITFYTNSTERMRILSTGNVGIGTSVPGQKLEVNLGTTGAVRFTYNDADGSAATYVDTTVASDGGVTFTAAGSAPDFTFSHDVLVPDEAYGAGWDGSLEVPTKNAVYDKIQSMGGGGIVETVVGGTGIDVDSTDTANPIVNLDAATIASLALADSATQPADLGSAAYEDTGFFATAAQGTLADSALQSADIGVSIQAYSAVLAATTASFLLADETKLDGIEAGADVTDATNVAAAGAVMEADTSTASMAFVIDEDNMASDSATKVPTQQSVKAYVDAQVGGGGITWNEVTGTSQTAAVNNGYITNNASLVTVTIPSTAAVGDVVRIGGKGAGGWAIAQNASEVIHFGNTDTTTGTGGSLASTNRYDAVELVCTTADTEWLVVSSVGNITIV